MCCEGIHSARTLLRHNINPWERKRVYTPEHTALTDKIDGIAEHFKNLLSLEEYKKFAEMQELAAQVDADDAVDIFEHAFCLGILLMIDIFGYAVRRDHDARRD